MYAPSKAHSTLGMFCYDAKVQLYLLGNLFAQD